MAEQEQPKRRGPPKHAYVPAPVPLWATMAIKALADGKADADQQQRGLRFIVENLCGTYDWPYRPGADDRETNVALGKQWVGQQIVKEVNINISKLNREDGEQ